MVPPLALLRLGVLEVSFFPLGFPRRKLPLTFLALIKREDVRQEAPGELFDLVLRDVGVVYELLPTTQFLPPMRCWKLRRSAAADAEPNGRIAVAAATCKK